MQIAVVGGGACSSEVREKAKRLGQIIASHGHVLICGGLGGVMEAACRGAREARRPLFGHTSRRETRGQLVS